MAKRRETRQSVGEEVLRIPPLPKSILGRLLEMAYGECGLTRGRVRPFRYERTYDEAHAYTPASDWTARDILDRGIDRVLDHVAAAREVGLSDEGSAFEPQRNVMQFAEGLDGGGSVAADVQGNVYVAWHGDAGFVKDRLHKCFGR